MTFPLASWATPLTRPTFHKFIDEAALDITLRYMLSVAEARAKTELPQNKHFMSTLAMRDRKFESINFATISSNVLKNYYDMAYEFLRTRLSEEEVRGALAALATKDARKAMAVYKSPEAVAKLTEYGINFQVLFESELKKQVAK